MDEKPRFPERIRQPAQLVRPAAQAVQEQTSQGLGCWHALRFRTFTCLAKGAVV